MVFNLALRMVWQRESAEGATQEILLKAVTRLSTFAGRSRFSTWLYRIAVNHLLDVRNSEMEEQSMTFTDLAASLDGCPDLDLPDERTLPVSHGLLLEEAKLGCVTAMLMCLDRRQRAAFILGDILGMTSEVGAEVLEISSDNFRQLLARRLSDGARRERRAFRDYQRQELRRIHSTEVRARGLRLFIARSVRGKRDSTPAAEPMRHRQAQGAI